MQMDLMKWLFIGELAFDLLVIQFSWHYEEITFLYLFLIQNFIQSTGSYSANKSRRSKAADWTMHKNNVQIWSFQCAWHQLDSHKLKSIFILYNRNFYTHFSGTKKFI